MLWGTFDNVVSLNRNDIGLNTSACSTAVDDVGAVDSTFDDTGAALNNFEAILDEVELKFHFLAHKKVPYKKIVKY